MSGVVSQPGRQPGTALGVEAREQARLALLKMIASGPLHKLAMRDAAREAGLGLATLYKYFGGKDQLVANVVLAEIETLLGLLERASRREVGVKARFQAFAAAHFTYLQDHHDGATALWLSLPAGFWSDDREGWLARRRDILAQILKSGVRDGSVRDDVWPNDLADLVLGAVDGYAQTALRAGDSPDPSTARSRLFSALWPMVSA